MILMNFGKRKYRGAFICVFILLVMVIWFVPVCFAVDGSEVSKAIDQAERDLNTAFAEVAGAEVAGAGVSMLLSELNSAGIYLSRANAAFNAGDFENAVVLAGNCSDAVKGVANEASNLRSSAEEEHSNTMFWAVFVSVFGMVSVIVLGFLGWGFLKRRYSTEVLNKRPKVVGINGL